MKLWKDIRRKNISLFLTIKLKENFINRNKDHRDQRAFAKKETSFELLGLDKILE